MSSVKATLHACAEQAYDLIWDHASAKGSRDLMGYCAIGSCLLADFLQQAGLEARLALWQGEDSGHVYVECAGFVLDVTAQQFGMSPIEVRRMATASKKSFWRAQQRFACQGALRAHLMADDWPLDQVPGEAYPYFSDCDFGGGLSLLRQYAGVA